MFNIINKDFKDDINNIRLFLNSRPRVSGCYCYGIGEQFTFRKIYKLILVCNDIYTWQISNKCECTKYIEYLKSINCSYVEYLGIKDNKSIIDYTIINENTFNNALTNWDNISIVSIFQKPFITIKSNNRLDKCIEINKNNSIITSLLLSDDNSFFDRMVKMYRLFNNDILESISLVINDYEYLKRMYINSKLLVNKDKLIKSIYELPDIIKKCIKDNKLNEVKLSYKINDKLLQEKNDNMQNRILINGILKNFNYNARNIKTKTLKGRINI